MKDTLVRLLFNRIRIVRTDNPLSILGDGWKHFRAEYYPWQKLYFKIWPV